MLSHKFFLVLPFRIFSVGLLLLAGCQATLKRNIGLSDVESVYVSLYPYYADLCAASQFRKRPNTGIEIEGGGFGGHSVLYLNGVCLAKGTHYPVLSMCDGPPGSNTGVGLSINAHYKNANWVATEGREFFFHGLVRNGERLTRATYDATVAQAEALGILDGIVFHKEAVKGKPAGLSLEDFKYQISLGTDYALNYARDRYCARIPLSRDQMAAVVRYLNGINAPYRSGEKDYEWDVLRDNCSHLIHNALAAANVWKYWPTQRPFFASALSFPVPKNEFVNLVRRTNDGPIADPWAVYNDAEARAMLLNDDRLPTAPGAIASFERIVQRNDVYDIKVRLIFYDDPVFGRYQRHYRHIVAEKRYTDLRANLVYFAQLYRRIEAQKKPLDWYLRNYRLSAASERNAFANVYERYFRYVQEQSALVERSLASIDEPRLAREGYDQGHYSVTQPVP